MNFNFSEDQNVPREEVRKFFAKDSPVSAARRVIDAGGTHAEADWQGLAGLGVGFPTYPGSPLCYIDGIGVPSFVAETDRLADLFGERIRPPQLLHDMAIQGPAFYGRNARAWSQQTQHTMETR